MPKDIFLVNGDQLTEAVVVFHRNSIVRLAKQKSGFSFLEDVSLAIRRLEDNEAFPDLFLVQPALKSGTALACSFLQIRWQNEAFRSVFKSMYHNGVLHEPIVTIDSIRLLNGDILPIQTAIDIFRALEKVPIWSRAGAINVLAKDGKYTPHAIRAGWNRFDSDMLLGFCFLTEEPQEQEELLTFSNPFIQYAAKIDIPNR